MPNGGDTLSAHIALPSLCFSNPIVRTRSWMPAITCWAATIVVEPPTLPAVCTRNTGFPDGGERVGEPQLWHHDALEHVRRLADDDRVDLVHRRVGVGESTIDRLADEPADRDIGASGGVLRLADAEHCATFRHHSPSMIPTRFCCRHGPLVQWASARSASPAITRSAASTKRASPAAICGLPHNAPPLGLTRVPAASMPSAWASNSS